LPQANLAESQGLRQVLSMHAAVRGQSELVRHSPGRLQPVPTAVGSPTKPALHKHSKLPGMFLQLKENKNLQNGNKICSNYSVLN